MNYSKPKVSVIIPTHNRHDLLMKAVDSALAQTVPVEVIVVDDASTQEAYKRTPPRGVTWIRRRRSTILELGFPCPGLVRNVGAKVAGGQHLAFLDDDDEWFPNKIERQLEEIEKNACGMCSTDAFAGEAPFSSDQSYQRYHLGMYAKFVESFFQKRDPNWNGMLPTTFDRELICAHNFIITSSVLCDASLFWKVGGFMSVPIGQEDGGLWRRMLEHTSCKYIDEPLVFYSIRPAKRAQYDGEVSRAARLPVRAVRKFARLLGYFKAGKESRPG
ncbi:MAG: glycosyltransferase family 2 protein [Pseudomarimonas sp.]